MQTVIAAALASGTLSAQPLPDAKFLLAHSGDELKKHKTYQMEIETSSANGILSTTSIFGSAPDRMRMESKDMTLVADGQYTWTYMPLSGQYTKRAAIGNGLDALDGASRDWVKGLRSASVFTTVRQEKLEIDGQVIDCWVIEMKPENLKVLSQAPGISFSEFSAHYWIDKDTGLQRQMVGTGKVRHPNSDAPQSVEVRTVYRSVKFDEPLPDSLFQFTPPAGAKEIANMMNVPDLVGHADTDTGRRHPMNILLWVLQVLAALLYGASGTMKIFMFDKISTDVPSFGALPREAWMVLGILELVCTAGLIVPAAFHWQPALTVVAATVLAIESLVFVWVHAKYGETPSIIMSGVLGLLMAFIAYGRMVLNPIS
jgi:outer membrane lipoprotein-sorting protein/uncharacterized membrane protein YphA (DoxX/SURF4 family)